MTPNIEHSVFSRGRQARFEAAGDKSEISIDEQFVHSSRSRSRSARKPSRKGSKKTSAQKSKKRCKTPFDSTMIVDGHLMPIRVNKQERNGHSAFRNPAKKAKKSKAQWSKRETDWFKFERRFILAVKTREERKKWIKTLNKLIPQ